MDIVFQGFFNDEGEVRTLGTVTVIVLSLVFMPFEGCGEHLFGLIDLFADLGQVGPSLSGVPYLSIRALMSRSLYCR